MNIQIEIEKKIKEINKEKETLIMLNNAERNAARKITRNRQGKKKK